MFIETFLKYYLLLSPFTRSRITFKLYVKFLFRAHFAFYIKIVECIQQKKIIEPSLYFLKGIWTNSLSSYIKPDNSSIFNIFKS